MTAAPAFGTRHSAPWFVAGAAALVLLTSTAFAIGLMTSRAAGPSEVRGVTVEAAGANGNGKVTGAPPKTFGIAGDVADLSPGVGAALVLTVSNPQAQAIDVESVDVAVGASAAGCAGSNISVGRFRGSARVAGRSTATITLPIEMRSNAPDACQGASFPLTYTGRAVQITGSNR